MFDFLNPFKVSNDEREFRRAKNIDKHIRIANAILRKKGRGEKEEMLHRDRAEFLKRRYTPLHARVLGI